jgi:hypothetical protein
MKLLPKAGKSKADITHSKTGISYGASVVYGRLAPNFVAILVPSP